MRPDRNNFAPRIGFAWKPFSKTVVRGGYGINYNTGAFQGIAQQLAFQPPFATTATNIEPSARPSIPSLTLQNGFPTPTGGITNNYAIDPNYRLGYVQIRNLDIQQQIRPTLLLNIDYTGTKGTDLDIRKLPIEPLRPAFGFAGSRKPSPTKTRSGRFGSQRRIGTAAQAVGERILHRRHLYIFQIDRRCVFHRRRGNLGIEHSGTRRRRHRREGGGGGAFASASSGCNPTSRRILSICRRSAAFPVSTRRTNSPPTICGNCPLATTSAGSPAILRCAPSWRLAMEWRLDHRLRPAIHAALLGNIERCQRAAPMARCGRSWFPGNR